MATGHSKALLDVLSQEQTKDIGAPLRARSKALLDVLSQEQTKEIAGSPSAAPRRHYHETGMRARAQPAARKSSTR